MYWVIYDSWAFSKVALTDSERFEFESGILLFFVVRVFFCACNFWHVLFWLFFIKIGYGCQLYLRLFTYLFVFLDIRILVWFWELFFVLSLGHVLLCIDFFKARLYPLFSVFIKWLIIFHEQCVISIFTITGISESFLTLSKMFKVL